MSSKCRKKEYQNWFTTCKWKYTLDMIQLFPFLWHIYWKVCITISIFCDKFVTTFFVTLVIMTKLLSKNCHILVNVTNFWDMTNTHICTHTHTCIHTHIHMYTYQHCFKDILWMSIWGLKLAQINVVLWQFVIDHTVMHILCTHMITHIHTHIGTHTYTHTGTHTCIGTQTHTKCTSYLL